jgi:xanthine dehydrogenase small subunit
MRDFVHFFLNGIEQQVRGELVFSSLSSYLRHDLGSSGTKVVCEEGDCGACTVLIGRAAGESFDYAAVNSCIQSLLQLDGTSVVTVEGLRNGAALHGVQEAMVACHGAQCGYCTPGFVVAMTALFETRDRVCEKEVRDGLTGNLCRCTGYEPIIKAALSVDATAAPRINELHPAAPMLEAMRATAGEGILIDAGGRQFAAPLIMAEAIQFKAEHAGVTVVQGATDVGVWINKRNFAAPAMLSLARIAGLDELRDENGGIVVGARVTLTQLEAFVETRIPALFGILNIFGSPQIKNAGTLAGNVANGSPIGDTLPFLFVAGAQLELTGTSGTRMVPIDMFYKGYRQFDLGSDELIVRIHIPSIGAEETLRLYKVSRRKDLDISAFTAAIRMTVADGVIGTPRIAFGGVGPTVVRMPGVEAFLVGRVPSEETFEEAGRIARDEIRPISDVRGGKDYRLQLAQNIFLKFFHDTFAAAGPAAERRGPVRPFLASGGTSL